MTHLDHHAIEAISDSLGRLYACRELERLPALVVREVGGLISADGVIYSDFAPSTRTGTFVAAPTLAHHEQWVQLFLKHAHSHPTLKRHFARGVPEALAISDMVSARQFHRLEIYDALYREMRVEDQLGIPLWGPGKLSGEGAMSGENLPGRTVGMGINRDRRSFTERDREVLVLMRPHLAQAYHNARAHSLVQRRLALREVVDEQRDECLIELNRNGQPQAITAMAVCWLREFFDTPERGKDFPDELARWTACLLAATPNNPMRPLIRQRGGQRLIVRLFAAGEDGQAALLLERRTAPESDTSGGVFGGAVRASLGLTPRQWQVLLEVEKGKTNMEIASDLGMEPSTVKKHLEHIYEKLNVGTRTAAVHSLRQALPRR